MSNALRDIAGSLRASIWIECPAAHVWKCAFEYPNWAPTVQSSELVAGGWDLEGGVVLVTKRDGAGLDPFYSRNLKLRPHEQMVYRVDTKDGDQMHGFLDVTFLEAGGRTHATYSNYLRCRFGPEVTLEDLQGAKGIEGIQNAYLKPLKEYSEKTWARERATASSQLANA